MADNMDKPSPAGTLKEDPVSFLKRITEECPDVMTVLDTKQLELLSKNPTDPYPSKEVNMKYMSDMSCYHSVKKKSDDARRNLSNAFLQPRTLSKQLDVEGFEIKKKILNELVERMKLVIDARLAATEEQLGEVSLPRIIRLCRKFKFNKNDTTIAIYILVAQLTSEHKEGLALFGTDCLTCCEFLDTPLAIMLEFLNKDRTHMEQGFFPDVQGNYILGCSITYDNDFFKVLMGSHLKSEEFLKIEHTQLADVITEEPEYEHFRNEKGTVKTPELGMGMEVCPGTEQEMVELPDTAEEGEGQPEVQEELDLDMILRMEREREKSRKEEEQEMEEEEEGEDGKEVDSDTDKLKPYKNDLEYLDDHFKLILFKIKVNGADNRMDMEAHYEDFYSNRQTQRYQQQKREANTKAKVQETKCRKRVALTKASGSWIPRLERMVQTRKLCEFERNVLLTLIGSVLQPIKFSSPDTQGVTSNKIKIVDLLRIFCTSLEEQIQHRRYFYKSGSLVHEGMVIVHSSGLTGDPSSAIVEIDRRMLDFCVGLDTEFSEIVEGSHLYYPKTKFDQVVLPKEQKSLILNTVSNFEAYKRCRKRMGMDDAITYGAGMVLLFHGSPGTGKTMMANALANKLSKKVLLINFPSLGSMTAGENFKFIFRESKINDAILFFDECEAIFESRDSGGHQVNLLLTEIERHDGLIILATNRPYDLDEAMHRRIMVAIEFRSPDHLLRKAIWDSHMPEQMTLADDIDLDELALRFELTGGFIKNAILSALSIAVSREGDYPVVCQKDLLQGANLQLRGRLRMKEFDRRVVPSVGLDEVLVEESLMNQLQQIVQFEKARAVLFGQWGFAKRNHQGLTILLHGLPGTGKTLVAEAIGYEVGKPLKVVNCGELLSKWVGESTKNIDAIFQEARHQDAILVFDEAEGLFGERTGNMSSTDRYANVDVGVLLYHIERFPGIIILTTNLIGNIDKAFFRRLRYVLQLNIPNHQLRAKLWKLIVPDETPLAEDVEFERLARHELCGGNIKSAVFRAAASAALREEGKRRITMKDLEDAVKDETSSTRIGFRRQDSDAARMYN